VKLYGDIQVCISHQADRMKITPLIHNYCTSFYSHSVCEVQQANVRHIDQNNWDEFNASINE